MPIRQCPSVNALCLLVVRAEGALVSQIASALVKLEADESSCLAIVPMGTANDFATGLGISDDPWEALQLAAHSTAHAIDVGTVNGKVSACRLIPG